MSRDELLGVKIEDIDRCLKEFYDGITHNRNQHLNKIWAKNKSCCYAIFIRFLNNYFKKII